MTILALAIIALSAGPASAVIDARQRNDAIFEFGRANYFHAVIEARDCDKTMPEQTRALNARFETAFTRLVKLYGSADFNRSIRDFPIDAAGPEHCPMTLRSFEDKIVQLEQRAAQGE